MEREYMKNYFLNNKAKYKSNHLKWRTQNREYVNEYMRNYMRKYRNDSKINKGKKGVVKLERKSTEGLKFIKKTVIIYF